MTTPIAELFRKTRLDMGLTQAQVAERLAQYGYVVGQTFITQVERGKSAPAVENAPAIAKAFHLDEATVTTAIMATKYPGLKLAAQPMKRSGVWVDLTPMEQKRLEEYAAERDWPSAAHFVRKLILRSLGAPEGKT